MRPIATAAAALALALLTFFQFPGHTYLQQDSQIYLPILEHLRDPSILQNDILAQQPHVAFTLYDEIARFLRALTGLDFRAVLVFQQILTRALGIWGLFLVGQAIMPGVSSGEAFQAALPAAICSLGAVIAGPTVLTLEYEPTPRAFAVPLLLCAIGLVAHHRYLASALASAAAFLYHPPTAVPFLVLFLGIIAIRRRSRAAIPLAIAAVILLAAARAQAGPAEAQTLFARLTPMQEQLQRMRAAYVWISAWPASLIPHYLLLAAVIAAAFARIRREVSPGLRVFLLGLPALGLLSMPLSWLFLEHWKWALIPQVQPLRALLFVTLFMQFLTAAAGLSAARRGRVWEAIAWFAIAYLPPLQPVLTDQFQWKGVALAVALGAATALAFSVTKYTIRSLTVAAQKQLHTEPRPSGSGWAFLPALVPLAAFFAIPMLGGVVNYPHLHTNDLAELSTWARSSTPRDAVFLFSDAGRNVEPGIFRSEALRAVYVDWKGGGQVNYLKAFAEQWWFRWQQTMARRFRPADPPRYEALGINYIVVQPKNRLPGPAAFENAKYVAYSLAYTPSPALQSR